MPIILYIEKIILLIYISKEAIKKKKLKENHIKRIRRIIELIREREVDFLVKAAIYSKVELQLKLIPDEILLSLINSRSNKKEVKILIDKLSIKPKDTARILNKYINVYGKPIPNYIRKTIAKTITKFTPEELLSCETRNTMSLKSLIRLTHPKPINEKQQEAFKEILRGKQRLINKNEKDIRLNGITGMYYENNWYERDKMIYPINKKSHLTSRALKLRIIREAKDYYEVIKIPQDFGYIVKRKDINKLKKYFKYLIKNKIYLDRLIYLTNDIILDEVNESSYVRKYRKYVNPNFKLYAVRLKGKGRLHNQNSYIKVIYGPIENLYKYIKIANKIEMLKEVEGYVI